MAEPFIISAQLQIASPSAASVSLLRANIKKQLGNLNAVVNLKVGSTAKLDELDKKVSKATSSVAKLSSESKTTAANLQQMGAAFANVKSNLASLGPSLGKINTSFANTTKIIGRARQETVSFAEQAGLASRRFLAFTLPTTAIFAFVKAISTGVKEIFTFERELIKIAQATDRPINTLSGLEKTVTNLSIGLGVSSSELINSAKALAQAGFTAKETEKALVALAKSDLAPSFESIAKSTEGMISIFQQFEPNAEKLEAVFGAINAVSAKYAVESDDIISAIQKTGGAFKVAGGNLNELIGLFTSVRQTTRESADTIAVAFRTIFTRLQRPETIDFLRKFNIELQEAGKFVGPVEAVKRINAVVSQLGQGDLRVTAIAEEIGGLRQISKTIPLIQQAALGQEAINTAIRGTDSLSEDAQQSLQGFLRQLAQVKEEFLAIFREMAKTRTFQLITSSLITLLHGANQLLRTFKELVPLMVLAGGFLASRSLIRGGAAGFVSKFAKKDVPATVIPFASGGVVPGPNVNKDIIPAMLMPGEFVLNKASVSKLGLANLTRINNSAGPPRQKGGITFFGPQEDLEPLVKAIADKLGRAVGKVSISTKASKIGGSSLLGSLAVPGALTKGVDIQQLTKAVTAGDINPVTGRGVSSIGKDNLALLTGLVTGIKEFGKVIEDTGGSVEQGTIALKQEIALARQRAIALKDEAAIAKQEADIAKQTSSLSKQKKSALKEQVSIAKVEKQVTSEIQRSAKAQITNRQQGTTIVSPQLFAKQASINPLLSNVIDVTEKQNRNQSRLQKFKLEDILGETAKSGSPLNVVLKETDIQNKEFQAFLKRNAAKQRALSVIPGRGVEFSGPGVLVPSKNRIFTENALEIPVDSLSGKTSPGLSPAQQSTAQKLPSLSTGFFPGQKLRNFGPIGTPSLVVPRTPFSASQRAQAARSGNILRRQLRDPRLAETIISNALIAQDKAKGIGGATSLASVNFGSSSPAIGTTFANGVSRLPAEFFTQQPKRSIFGRIFGGRSGGGSGGGVSVGGAGSSSGRFSGLTKFGTPLAIAATVGGEQVKQIGTTNGNRTQVGIGGALSGAGTGALIGGTIGSAIPVVGTAIGATVGAVVGGIAGLTGSLSQFDEQLKQAKLEEQLNNIGEGFRSLSQSIGSTDVSFIDSAALKLLDDIKEASGSVTQFTPEGRFTSEFKNLRGQRADLERQFLGGRLDKVKEGTIRERIGEAGLKVLGFQDPSKFQGNIEEFDDAIAESVASILGLTKESLLAKIQVEEYTNAIRRQTSILDIVSDKYKDISSGLDNVAQSNSFVAALGEGIGGFQQQNKKLSLGSSLFNQNLTSALGNNPQLAQASQFANEVNAAFTDLRQRFAGGLLDELIGFGAGPDEALKQTIGNLSTSDNVKNILQQQVDAAQGDAVGVKDASTILKDLFGSEALALPIDKLNSVIEEQTSALDKHANIMKGIAEFSQRVLSQTQTVNNSIQTARLSIAELQASRTGQSVSSIVGSIGTNTFEQNQGLLGAGTDPNAIGADVRSRILGLRAFTAAGGGNTATGISSIIAEQASITNLVQSLKNLTDPTNLAADAIRELSEVEEERAARLSLLSNFLGQGAGGRRNLLRTAENAKQFAVSGAGFFDSLSTQRQKELLDFVSSNAGISIGGRRLGAIANEQLPLTAGGRQLESLGFGLDGLNAERASLENEIVFANETAIAAQRQLLEILQTQGSLLQDTTAGFEEAVSGFNGAVASFANAVDRIPSSIELRGINEIQVNIAGTNGLSQLSTSIQRQVLSSVADKLKQVIPEASAKIDRSFG